MMWWYENKNSGYNQDYEFIKWTHSQLPLYKNTPQWHQHNQSTESCEKMSHCSQPQGRNDPGVISGLVINDQGYYIRGSSGRRETLLQDVQRDIRWGSQNKFSWRGCFIRCRLGAQTQRPRDVMPQTRQHFSPSVARSASHRVSRWTEDK
jgi:hypothetical protein